MKRTCRVEGCDHTDNRGSKDSGLCGMHYLRWIRYGRLHTIVNRGSGWTVNQSGYVMIWNGKWEYEHRLVAEKALGKPLPPDAVIHHVDGDSMNNRPSNLVVCPDQGYHRLLHIRMKEYEDNKRR